MIREKGGEESSPRPVSGRGTPLQAVYKYHSANTGCLSLLIYIERGKRVREERERKEKEITESLVSCLFLLVYKLRIKSKAVYKHHSAHQYQYRRFITIYI